ncbi:hypothetical protein VTJ04DRAFT_7831 [Mycothermus thermophilus]|uniref:uncharacterized protein n=1 Tax=Humicola insolens TaxID=85995 RepID=UPI003742F5EB
MIVRISRNVVYTSHYSQPSSWICIDLSVPVSPRVLRLAFPPYPIHSSCTSSSNESKSRPSRLEKQSSLTRPDRPPCLIVIQSLLDPLSPTNVFSQCCVSQAFRRKRAKRKRKVVEEKKGQVHHPRIP